MTSRESLYVVSWYLILLKCKNPRMTNKFYIGLSVTYHDSALAIVDEQGEILFAESTERYLQYKRALNCEPDTMLRIADLIRGYCDSASEFSVAFNWNRKRPFYEKFCALADYFSPSGLMRPRFSKSSTFLKKYQLFHMLACQTRSMSGGGINLANRLRHEFPRIPVRYQYFNHHLCHGITACYSSGFDQAVCIIVDSYGESGSLAFYHYLYGKLRLLKEVKGIESLGFLYMKLTELCGFDWLKGEEWKVMGLAPYGHLEPEILEILRSMIRVESLEFRQSLKHVRNGLQKIEGMAFDPADMAYTGQYFFSEFMEQVLSNLYDFGLSENLVLSGGCALNSSFNGEVLNRTKFKNLYVPSAPADDGTALGAAMLARNQDHPNEIKGKSICSAYLGSAISSETLERLIEFGGISNAKHLPETIFQHTAELLAKGCIVGWVQGKAEFGPRALGNRSILADPRDKSMKDKINQRVKLREEYRPFAPSILHEFGDQYFEGYQESPYMERTLRFRAHMRAKVPAVVHVDGTGRLQTVKREWNSRFHDLIQYFHRLTGVPVLLNTSFNVMGKPIIHSVEDAVSVFFTTGMDALVIGDYLFVKPGVAESS